MHWDLWAYALVVHLIMQDVLFVSVFSLKKSRENKIPYGQMTPLDWPPYSDLKWAASR